MEIDSITVSNIEIIVSSVPVETLYRHISEMRLKRLLTTFGIKLKIQEME